MFGLLNFKKEIKMNVTIWSKPACQYCDMAKSLLMSKGIEFQENKIGEGYTRDDLLAAVPTARTVPQIFVDDKLIGGFQELKAFLA
jgi:glutaredoxin 3